MKNENNGYKQFFNKAHEVRQSGARPARRPQSSANFKIKHANSPSTSSRKKDSYQSEENGIRERMKMRRARAPFPWKAVAGLMFSVALAAYFLLNPQSLEKIIDKIEVQAIGAATANESKPA
jgi:hypothetical protein